MANASVYYTNRWCAVNKTGVDPDLYFCLFMSEGNFEMIATLRGRESSQISLSLFVRAQ